MDVMQRVLRILARLDLKHKECRRARISPGYKAGEPVILTTLVKLLLKMSRKMGKKLKEPGKTLSEGSPTLAMGFYPPRAFPQPIPFGNGTPGLIGWHPWPILAPGVLRSWENSFFPSCSTDRKSV